MATVPKTVKTYALTGALKDFPITFEYLARKFVAVTLIGTTRKDLVLNVDYRFSTPTTITTIRSSGWGVADGFDLIEIRRLTSATDRLVDFADGSILRALDLNTSQIQSLHIAEEARDLTADTIGVNSDGDLDARGKRIANLGDAINPGDAVTLRQEQAWGASALNQANASATSAAASQASRLASEVAKTGAQTAQAAAEAARNLSQDWSSKAEDSVVSSGLYSSYHYSRKSAAQVTLAATQATNAAASATASANSATASAGSASAAATSKTGADSAAAAANTSKLAAAVSEANAQAWAGTVGMPPASGQALKFLRQNASTSGLEYVDIMGVLNDPWAFQPIGKLITVMGSGVAPPSTGATYRYIVLENDTTYNSGGVLTSVSITGADPLIVATAVVTLDGSPLNGQTIRLLNEERRFVRPGKNNGALTDSTNLSHGHGVYDPGHAHSIGVKTGTAYTAGGVFSAIAGAGGTGSAATGIAIQNDGAAESQPRSVTQKFYMRIK